MIQKRIISIFLLCLLLAVNWHNTFLHSHQELEQGEHATVHHHKHHHHHHDHSIVQLWDWIKHALGDFDHPDLGDNHLELFLHPNHQSGLAYSIEVDFHPFPAFWQAGNLYKSAIAQQSKVPVFDLSFSDPPCLDIPSNRGPPLFS